MNELIKATKNWGREKGINNPIMQYAKINEEIGEIAHELTRGNLKTSAMADAIGDVLVTLIIFADILGFDLEQCLRTAYNEIKERQGENIDGAFVKSSSNKNKAD